MKPLALNWSGWLLASVPTWRFSHAQNRPCWPRGGKRQA